MSTAAPRSPSQPGITVANSHAYTEKNSTWKIEFSATRPAQNSGSPLARSFHTSTIAMQRARPMMMSPIM